MRSPSKLVALLLCAVSACALALQWSSSQKTSYQGKSLSKWVSIFSRTKDSMVFDNFCAAEKEQAANAIRHIGTNGLPLLLTLVDTPTPTLWQRACYLSVRLPDWIRYSTPANWFRHHHSVVLLPGDATSIAEALGPAAAPVIPELTQRLTATNWTGQRDVAFYALACTGPEALAKSAAPFIPMLLTNSHARVRMNATNALRIITLEASTGARAQ
jgi:hypothetical protein